MWILDKNGHAINSDQIMGIFVATDPDDAGAYEVQANDSDNTLIAQFAVDEPMDEADATALYTRMCNMLGTIDLND
jgi:hypothetical protein